MTELLHHHHPLRALSPPSRHHPHRALLPPRHRHGVPAARDLLLPEPRSRHRVRHQLRAAALHRDVRVQREPELLLLRVADPAEAEQLPVSASQTRLVPQDSAHHQRV